MRIQAVIFDMDGVIIDSEAAYFERMAEFFHHIGVRFGMEDMKILAGASKKHYTAYLQNKMGEDWDCNRFFQEMDAYFVNRPMQFEKILFPYIKELFHELKAQGFRIALASSSSAAAIQEVVEACGISDVFEFCLSGDEFEESKPNPEIYITAAKKLGLSCDECAVVEDSTYGVIAGHRAGMFVICRRDERFGYDQSKADVLIDRYEEVLPILMKQSK